MIDLSNPFWFFVALLAAGFVIVGLYFALRELIADGILLADKKRQVQQVQERNKRQ